jgi:hypothetical protein
MKSQLATVLFVLGVFALLTQTAAANVTRDTVPDAGSTALLTGLAVTALAATRRFIRR